MFAGDAFCIGCTHAFECMDDITEEEMSSDEDMSQEVANLNVVTPEKTKATNTEGTWN